MWAGGPWNSSLICMQRRTLKRDFKEPREGVWRSRQDGNGQIVMENQKFEDYYKLQGIVPEGEWDAFMTTLRKPLPVTFRINGRGRFAEALRLSIESKWGSKAQVLMVFCFRSKL